MKIVEVAGVTSVEPQSVPGFDDTTFPAKLSDLSMTEKELADMKDGDGNPVFRIRQVKDVPAKDEGTAVEAVVAEGSEG